MNPQHTLMALIRVIYKTLLLIPVVLIGAILAILILRNTMPTQGFTSRLAQSYHRLLISVLGVRLTVYGEKKSGNVLFVPNHISWLDIPILGALAPVHFLSKTEIKNWPIIGLLATRAGTLYIKRGEKNGAEDANSLLQKTLEKKHNVVLFAEGTTTDGTLKKFHGRLMQSAIDADSLVQPVAIFYPVNNNDENHIGKKNSAKKEINRKILYIDHMTFLHSAFNILGLKNIPVEVHYLKPISTINQTRNDLAAHCYENIYAALNKA